ncbi:hypothetical protein QUF76_11870, partial [Desulfobacterales bacterium HSG16]|nr:hypothetical protein [Desulfobacterales bacterium HSG16]
SWIDRVFKRRQKNIMRIKNQIENLFDSVKDSCHCKLLDELKDISKDDVRNWFAGSGINISEAEKIAMIEKIFSDRALIPMSRIEVELEKIVEQYSRDKSGLH